MIGITQHMYNEINRMAAGGRRLAFRDGVSPVVMESLARKIAAQAHRIAVEQFCGQPANENEGTE